VSLVLPLKNRAGVPAQPIPKTTLARCTNTTSHQATHRRLSQPSAAFFRLSRRTALVMTASQGPRWIGCPSPSMDGHSRHALGTRWAQDAEPAASNENSEHARVVGEEPIGLPSANRRFCHVRIAPKHHAAESAAIRACVSGATLRACRRADVGRFQPACCLDRLGYPAIVDGWRSRAAANNCYDFSTTTSSTRPHGGTLDVRYC
jgi:hypothetical protein